MTDDRAPGEWRREELRPKRAFPLPWLALAGVVATIVAATTLVAGIGSSLGEKDPPGRLLPLQAASPSATPSPTVAPDEEKPEDMDETRSPQPSLSPERPRLYDALITLRHAVHEGVRRGDVRDDVGLDLTNVIERILKRNWSHRESRRRDVDRLHHKISTRAREGAIDDDLADEFHLILERATD